MRYGILWFIACCLFQLPALASDSAELAAEPTWLKLLHFDRTGVFSSPRSAVADPDFFLADNGHRDPHAELLATLAALEQAPDPQNLEHHALCRFPARAMWLQSRLQINTPDDTFCHDWKQWQQDHADGAVGLTFATGYLGNPASFFGHLLLHVGQPNENQTALRLLDSSLNFGADIAASDNMLTYMAKGLFGGYQARFSSAPFYRNNAVYSESEMRDLWHYELDLSDAEQEFLVAHLWEVLGYNFDYLFLTQNCASRIARTLALVIDDDLGASYAPWVAPETVVRRAAPYTHSATHVPSRRLQTEQQFHALSSDAQAAALAVWPQIHNLNLNHPEFTALSEREQSQVLNVLLSHLLFLEQSGEDPVLNQYRLQLLSARLQRPTAPTSTVATMRTPVHETTPSTALRVQGVYNSKLDNTLRLQFRPIHYDLLESGDDRMPYAALELARVTVDYGEAGLKLKELLLAEVTNLNAHRTGLPTLPQLAWQAQAGWRLNDLDCENCGDAYLTLAAGQSWRFGSVVGYAMASGTLRTTSNQQGWFAPGVRGGFIQDWNGNNRSLLSLRYDNALQGSESRRAYANFEHRVQLNRTTDFRLQIKADDSAQELSAGFSWYF